MPGSPAPSDLESLSSFTFVTARSASAVSLGSDEDEIVYASPRQRLSSPLFHNDEDDFILISPSTRSRPSDSLAASLSGLAIDDEVQPRRPPQVVASAGTTTPPVHALDTSLHEDTRERHGATNPTQPVEPLLVGAEAGLPTRTAPIVQVRTSTLLDPYSSKVVVPIGPAELAVSASLAQAGMSGKAGGIRLPRMWAKAEVSTQSSVSSPALTVKVSKPTKKKKAAPRAALAPSLDPADAEKEKLAKAAEKKARKAQKRREKAVAKLAALPSPQLKDSSIEEVAPANQYQSAVQAISAYLRNPVPPTSPSGRLHLLHSLIVELGVVPVDQPLPSSLRAATNLIKTRVFINVRDYVDFRGQGQEALRRVMLPSRAALVKDVRKRRVKLAWIKERGLNALLVSTHG